MPSRRKKSSSTTSDKTESTSTSTQSTDIVSKVERIISGQVGEQKTEESTPVTASPEVMSSLILFSINAPQNLELPVDEIPGVGRVTAARLSEIGVTKIKHLLLMSPEELHRLTGIDLDRCKDIIQNAKRLVKWRDFITAYELKQRLSQVGGYKFKLHCQGIDKLLGGGFKLGAIYELVGEFGTGKTQICHQASVTIQLPFEQGGLYGAVVYIDTEGTFSIERIEQIANRFKLNVDEVLRNIYYQRAYTTDDILNIILKLPILAEEVKNSTGRDLKLIVIDSLLHHLEQNIQDVKTYQHVLKKWVKYYLN